ncbi:TetR family transcriptional regulator [Fonticella tunisiensis]|uniref:TetR family transcriptional regulator n=1 Tax=Fonticella tunisiensis TaxID=1096341 RepID=A0A4V3ETA8_9CLOT|nr:TetR family transcriptional regulator [Fonticella tunisiensis]
MKNVNKTKKLIFDAAIKSFSQKGFHKTTVDEIAESAGVAKGTLYYHFKSKEEIFKFIIDEGTRIIEEEILDRTEHLEDPVEKLRTICYVHIELVTKHVEFFKTILSQMWGNEERQNQLRDVLAGYFKLIEKYLTEAADEKYIKDKNMEIIAFNFFGVMISTIIYSLMHREKNVKDLADTFVDFIMGGIGK